MEFHDQINMLNPQPGERFSANYKFPNSDIDIVSILAPPEQIPAVVATFPITADIWIGVNPIADSVTRGRGVAADVTRLTALYCDLDVKETGCATTEVAEAIISDLAGILEEEPSFVVHTGHGIQPYWVIDPEGMWDNGRLQPLLRRWGQLVKLVAKHRGAQVDSVFDLSRILRAVGTRNNKDVPGGGVPIDVAGEIRTGGPMTLEQIMERLDAHGIPQAGKEDDFTGESDPGSWLFPDATPCGYSISTVRYWKTDTPQTGRHPWLMDRATRLAAMHRKGCLTQADYQHAITVLRNRFEQLCVGGIGGSPRPVSHKEIEEALDWGRDLVSTMSEDRLDSELGNHTHHAPTPAAAPVAAQGNTATTTVPSNVIPINAGATAPAIVPTPYLTYGHTETAAAAVLIDTYRDTMRFCPELKRWMQWNGQRWENRPDRTPATEAVAAVALALNPGPNDAAEKALQKRLLSNAGSKAVIELAQHNSEFQVARDLLDAHGYELNTPTGIVDLRTGQMRDHDQYAWHTRTTGVEFPCGPWPTAPKWAQFLHDTFDGDDTLIDYMQQLFGYSAIGEVTHHVLPFLYGAGQNGKSVVLEVIRRVLGDYAIVADGDFLVAGKDKHTTEIASLAGARMVVCSEVNEDSKFDEALVKRMTGGDAISGRFLYQRDKFYFKPSHTLFLAGNHQPGVGAGGDSFWRRLRLIPFMHRVPDEKKNERLADELVTEEGPAILAWIVAGAKDVAAHGISEPDVVKAATDEYADSEDVIGQFIEERLDLLPGAQVQTNSALIYDDYQSWCSGPAKSRQVFGRELSARLGATHKPSRTRDGRFVPGVTLRHPRAFGGVFPSAR